MKQVFALLFCLLVVNMHAQTNSKYSVATNECVELLNTVWVLANGTSDIAVSAEVTKHFGKYSELPVVRMLDMKNADNAMYYRTNFEYIPLPYLGLKMSVDKGKLVLPDRLWTNDPLLALWKPEKRKALLKELNKFYAESDFHSYFLNNLAIKYTEQNVYRLTNRVDLDKINQIFGSSLTSVTFYQTVTPVTDKLGVPFINIDGNIMPLFYNHISEMQSPSAVAYHHFIKHPKHHSAGYIVITALTVDCLKKAADKLPGIYYAAVVELLNVTNPDYHKLGIDNNNFMAKWLSMLINEKYSHNNANVHSLSVLNAERMGFIWQADAMEFMENYYSNRQLYPQLHLFIPQLAGYIVQLASVADDLKADYDVAHRVFVKNVYPTNLSELDMSTDSITIRVVFSQPVHNVSGIAVNALHAKVFPVDTYSYQFVSNNTLRFTIATEAARKFGFYGLFIGKNWINTASNVKLADDFSVSYIQPLPGK